MSMQFLSILVDLKDTFLPDLKIVNLLWIKYFLERGLKIMIKRACITIVQGKLNLFTIEA